MIIPSVDIMDGQTVQLVQGREKVIEAGDPKPWVERFALVGEVAIVDLDAALGRGSNRELIESLLPLGRCRVGGGIRSVDDAIRWLDRGAERIVLGTAARPDVLRELPADRVIAALDAVRGEVVVEGWQAKTGRSITDVMEELDGLVGEYLVTFVEREGGLGGLDLGEVAALRTAAGGARLTVAGGVKDALDVASVDRLGADAQVGMAIYRGHLHEADAIAEMMTTDRADGRWATVVVDENDAVLGQVWSSSASLRQALDRRMGIYDSRKRGLWVKGESSGATQELLGVDMDCDRDALRFRVRQRGSGFCHQGTTTCFGASRGFSRLLQRMSVPVERQPSGSFTRRLLQDPGLLRSKLVEEAVELAAADTHADVVHEAADVAYFLGVAMRRAGVEWSEVEAELDRRALKVTRRSQGKGTNA